MNCMLEIRHKFYCENIDFHFQLLQKCHVFLRLIVQPDSLSSCLQCFPRVFGKVFFHFVGCVSPILSTYPIHVNPFNSINFTSKCPLLDMLRVQRQTPLPTLEIRLKTLLSESLNVVHYILFLSRMFTLP